MSAGSQMLLGIRLNLDAQGMVTGATVADSSLQKVQESARRTQTSLADTGEAMKDAMNASLGVGAVGAAAYGAGKAIEDAITPAIDQAKSFQVEMSQLGFVSKATQDELRQLEQVALRTGLETQFSPQEAASAIRMLKAAGLSTQQSLESLSATLDTVTGSAGMMELQTGASSTAAALLKFSHTGETARKIMDVFANATRETNLQFQDLPIFINSLRDAPSKLQATSSEIIALVGVLKNAGMQAAQAGQTVDMFANKFLVNYRKLDRYMRKKKITEQDLLSGYVDEKMPQAVAAFQKLNVSMFDAQGNLRNMTEFFGDLIDASSRLTGESQRTFLVAASTLFGAKGGPLITALRSMKRGSLEGRAAFEDLVKTLEKSEGVSRQAAAAFEDTQTGLEVFIQGTKDTINIAMGKTLLPFLKSFGDIWKSLLGKFLEFVDKNPALAKSLMFTAGVLMYVAKVVGIVLMAFAGLLFWTTMIAPALAAAGGAAGLAAVGFAALQAALWPLLVIGAAVIAVFAAVSLVLKVFDHLKNGSSIVAKSFQRLMETFRWIRRGVSDLWSGEEGQEKTIKVLKAMGLYGIVTWIVGIGRRIQAVFQGFVDGLSAGFAAVGAALYPLQMIISYLIDAFRRLFEAWGPMKDAYEIARGWRMVGFVLGWIASVVLTALILKVALLALPFVILAAKVVLVVAVISAVVYGLYKLFVGLGTLIGWVAFKIYEFFVWLNERAFAFGAFLFLQMVRLKVILTKLAITIYKSVTAPLLKFGGYIRTTVENALRYLVGLRTRAAQAAQGFISAFFDTLRNKWEEIKAWFSNALQWIRDRLPGSDAKTGPLSTLTMAGKGFTTAFGEGIESGAPALEGTVTHTLGNLVPDGTPAGAYAVPDIGVGSAAPLSESGTSINSNRTGSSITIQNMTFHVAQATAEEAEGLAQTIMARIREMMDQEQEIGFI